MRSLPDEKNSCRPMPYDRYGSFAKKCPDRRPENRLGQEDRPSGKRCSEQGNARQPVEEDAVAGVHKQQPRRENGRPRPKFQRDGTPGDDDLCSTAGLQGRPPTLSAASGPRSMMTDGRTGFS